MPLLRIYLPWLFALQICCDYLLWEFAAAICRRNLPQLFAVAFCRGNLPQPYAVAFCHGNLPWEFAAAICRGYLPWVCFVYVKKPFFCVSEFFFFVNKPFLIESKSFSYKSKTFIYENFFFNSVSFCYCRGSYGPPYFLSFSFELIQDFAIIFQVDLEKYEPQVFTSSIVPSNSKLTDEEITR